MFLHRTLILEFTKHHVFSKRSTRASFDVRGLPRAGGALDHLGCALCLLLPFIGLWTLQGESFAALTHATFLDGLSYQLWTGHWIHYTFEHFAWDALMFVVFATLLWREERWRIFGWLALGAPLISITVFRVDSSLMEYRGLSALDTMLFTRYCLGVVVNSRALDRCLFGVLPLVALSAKISYELFSGTTLFVSDLGPGVVPLPSAHFAGLVLGVVWALCFCRGRR